METGWHTDDYVFIICSAAEREREESGSIINSRNTKPKILHSQWIFTMLRLAIYKQIDFVNKDNAQRLELAVLHMKHSNEPVP